MDVAALQSVPSQLSGCSLMTFALGACSYPYLWSRSLRASLEDIREQGFQVVELMVAPPHFDTMHAVPTPGGIRDLLRDLDISLISLNLAGLDFNLASPWEEVRALSVREYLRLIDLAGEVGAPFVAVIPGKRHPLLPADTARTFRWACESLGTLSERARQVGVRLAVENLPFGFLETVAQVESLLDTLGDTAVGMLFDAANAHMVEDEVVAAQRAVRRTWLVHLSDTTKQRWEHNPPGTGEVHVAGVTEALREGGYMGDAVLELTSREPSTAFAASAAYLEPLGWERAAFTRRMAWTPL